MSQLLSSSPRLFSVEAANKTLPLVSAIASDLIPLWKSVTSTRKRLKHLIDTRGVEEGNPYSDELGAMQDRLVLQTNKVESLIDELRQIGAEFKGANGECHVCFPAMLEGKLVYLSWCPGDIDVSHWMEFDADFADRQPVMESASVAD